MAQAADAPGPKDLPDATGEPPESPCLDKLTDGLGPEMVLIEAGSFSMGAPDGEPDAVPDERPRHAVTITRPFAIARCETTRGAFSRFVADTAYITDAERAGGCFTYAVSGGRWERRADADWRRPGFTQTDSDPVVCVSYNDASAYARWLSLRTGIDYRLPSEAEWEYIARAGTTTPFWTGDCIHTDQANYNGRFDYDSCGAETGLYRRETVPAGSLPANPWGLHEVAGNVWEWTEDCWHTGYEGAPTDGGPWLEANGGDCGRRVLRGGSWSGNPGTLRSAYRFHVPEGDAYDDVGFRLARTLPSGL